YVSPFAFPLIRWIIATVEFLFSLLVVFAVFLFLKDTWTIHIIILPLIIIPWSLLGLGAGMTAAVLFTFFRDIRPIVQMLLMIAFFSAPILFKPGLFETQSLQAQLLTWHPITYFAALFQKPFHQGIWPASLDWGISMIISLLCVWGGFYLMNRFKGKFYYYL
nr:hypothetical protein [Phycisphaerae bacterium]